MLSKEDRITYNKLLDDRVRLYRAYRAYKKQDRNFDADMSLRAYNSTRHKLEALEVQAFPSLKRHLLKYCNVIVEEGYYYDQSDIIKMFDYSLRYMQVRINKEIKAMFITAPIKSLIRDISRNYKLYIKDNKITEEEYELIEKACEQIDLKRVLYYNKESIAAYIKHKYLRVFRTDAENRETESARAVTDEEVDLILNNKLYSAKSLLQIKNMEFNAQLYRYLNTEVVLNRIYKFKVVAPAGVAIDTQKPTVRFLLKADIESK